MSTVMQFECERLLDAMLAEVAEGDRRGTDVEAALRRVALAGGEWLSELGEKEACFFAAYEQLSERLGQRVREECECGDPWPERVWRCLSALLEGLAAQPWTAQVLIRSFPALGPEALNRYQGFVEGFALLLEGGRKHSGTAGELPTDVELLAVGAAEAIICEEIEAGRAEGLPAMAPAILFSLLVPFVGPVAAAEEMTRVSAPGREGEGLRMV